MTGPGERPGVAEVWRWFAEGSPTGIGVVDRHLRFRAVNARLAAINAVPVEDHLGRHPAELFPGEPGASMAERFLQVLESGTALEGVQISGARTADGQPLTVVADYFPLRDDAGHLVAAACSIVDVTDERRAQRRLRALIDGLFTFVGLLDPDGTLVEANRTALDAAGLEPEDVLGRPFWDAYWWSHDRAAQERLCDAVERGARGEVSRYDAVVRVRDGRLITIDFQLVPIVEDGVVTALVPSGMDITERQRDVELLEATGTLARRLSSARSSSDAIDVILTAAGRALGADFVNVALLDPATGSVHLHNPEHLQEDLAERYQVVEPAGPTLTAEAIRSAEAQVLHGPDDHGGRFRELYADVVAAGLACIAAVPLRSGERVVGALGVGWAEDRLISTAEQARLDTVAKLCAQTLDRTRRGDHHQEFLNTLQGHLLPEPPAVDGLELAVRYEPATDHLGFGGDWYDVLPLDEDRTVVIVGDIVGHGIEAAARMSQVRGILVGLVEVGIPLEELLARAARPLARLSDGYLGTAAIAVVDTARGSVEYVCAGHPPPLLRHPDGSVTVLGDGRRTVLGLPTGTASPGTADLPPGSTLLLYSDGLTERRGEPVDDGIARLAAALASVDAGEALDSQLEQVAVGLLDGRRRADDVAAVLAHRPA